MSEHAPTIAAAVRRAEISEHPLDIAQHARDVEHAAGATVTFAGVVRNHDGGRAVASLNYSCHPQAGQIITRIANEKNGSTRRCSLWVPVTWAQG